MDKIGIIGFGSMGSMMLYRFLKSEVIKSHQVMVSSLPADQRRLKELQTQYPPVKITYDNRETAAQCNRIFICVKPLEVKDLMEMIADSFQPGAHVISIAASVTLDHLEQVFPGKISRLVPSITSTLDNGISLLCHNPRVQPQDALYLETLLNSISTVKTIDEEAIDAVTNLTSTAPGLIAAMFRDFVEAGMKYSHFSQKKVENLVIAIFHQISVQSRQDIIHLPNCDSCTWQLTGWRDTRDTGQGHDGQNQLIKKLPPIFTELFDQTLGKFEAIKTQVSKQFEKGRQYG